MCRNGFLSYAGRDPEEAARRLPGPGPDAETVSVSPSARLIQDSITKTHTIYELPFGECLETSSALRLNQIQHQPRPYALLLSEQTKPFQSPSLHAHSPNCNGPKTLGSTVLLGKCTLHEIYVTSSLAC